MKNKPRICLCTPFYLNEQSIEYANSIKKLYHACAQRGIALHEAQTVGDAVNRQRNVLAAMFLAKLDRPEDVLLFWDADTGCDASHVLRMYDMFLPVVGANYPQRRYTADYRLVGTIMPIENPDKRNGATEVAYAGTGLMLIRRCVLADIAATGLVEKLHRGGAASPELVPHFWRFFAYQVKDGDDAGEDWSFCDLVRAAGYRVYADPLTICSHTGPHTWEGRAPWPLHHMERTEVDRRRPVQSAPIATSVGVR